MNTPKQIVVSASRRTDIPAFYMPWFMDRIQRGRFEVVNPYNGHVTIVPATPDVVHTIVFWSKNFGPFIEGDFGRRLQQKGYHLFFNFSINSESSVLEPHVPPLRERLSQLQYLSRHFGAAAVNWRFDPICFFKTGSGEVCDNLADFAHIAQQAARWGVKRCITSFMDLYPKVQKRTVRLPGFTFVDPPLEEKVAIVLQMEKELASKNIRLYTCCEKPVLEALPEESTVARSACIPNDLLMHLFGGRLSRKADPGQRRKSGCGCRVAADIGSYHRQPCYHNCLFCYANPSPGRPVAV